MKVGDAILLTEAMLNVPTIVADERKGQIQNIPSPLER